eukprot:TRINITY_DN12158_c0_g1_i2.p3 TRINITY_DN12158_c0_g1~~TRINITY_DN12158_c0_g1_i2.p3  ORF type:complete len:104 (+),score=1.49 TRINITY_DN12158_c0_g1_i2:391-702(+)
MFGSFTIQNIHVKWKIFLFLKLSDVQGGLQRNFVLYKITGQIELFWFFCVYTLVKILSCNARTPHMIHDENMFQQIGNMSWFIKTLDCKFDILIQLLQDTQSR